MMKARATVLACAVGFHLILPALPAAAARAAEGGGAGAAAGAETQPPPDSRDAGAAREGPEGKRSPGAEASPVDAGAVTEEAERVGPLEVLAPPILEGTRVDRSGSQITTVSDRQIEGLNAQDLTGAVRRVPGVVISRYNHIGSFGGGDGGSIFIRGQGSGRPGAEISTRVDGIARFAGVWTHPILDTMNIDTAQRIDVYKSAQPVTFGNMSFGAINLIPKQVTQPGFTASAVGAYGMWNSLILRGEQGGKVDAFDYYLIGSHRESDGHRENAGGEVDGLFGRVGMEIDEAKHWYASILVDHTAGNVSDPEPWGAPPLPRKETFQTSDQLYILSLSNSYEKLEGSIKVYYEDGLIDWEQWDSTVPEPFSSLSEWGNFGVHVQESLRAWEGGEVTVGYDHDLVDGKFREDRPSGDRYKTDTSFFNTGPYLLVSQLFKPSGDDWELIPSAGARYNESRHFGGDWGAQAGLASRFQKTEIHANYARAFNVPGPYVVVNYKQWGRGDQWEDLDTEILDHVEGGVSQGITEWLRVDFTWFFDSVDDALRFVPPPPPPPLFANIGHYEATGPEVALELSPLENLKLFAAATYTHTHPSDVPNVPRWTAISGVSYSPVKQVTLNMDFEWVDDRTVLNPRYASSQDEVGEYYLLNARADYRIHQHVLLFAAAENLLDYDYEYRPGYPMPGISVMGGIQLNFEGALTKR